MESNCYEQSAASQSPKKSFFIFRSYYDNDLLQNVGAIVSYNNSQKRITLAYADEFQSNSGDQQKVWLEILNGKINGKYVQHESIDGNPAGKLISYTNQRNNITVVYRLSTIGSPCATENR